MDDEHAEDERHYRTPGNSKRSRDEGGLIGRVVSSLWTTDAFDRTLSSSDPAPERRNGGRAALASYDERNDILAQNENGCENRHVVLCIFFIYFDWHSRHVRHALNAILVLTNL